MILTPDDRSVAGAAGQFLTALCWIKINRRSNGDRKLTFETDNIR